ncbi:MAG: sulfotransferase [Stagnimonas sp.]|nr:sulfotransferase [Stagnimonas sp.]
MSNELQRAYSDLLAELKAIEERLRTLDPPLDEPDLLESYRWIFSLLGAAIDVYVWGDTARPRFTDIVGPYRKWGGDNADAYYQVTAIDPARTYKVTVRPGNAVYWSLTIYGGPDDGRYSNRIVGIANNRTVKPAVDGSYSLWLSPTEQPGNWLKLEPDAVVGLTRDYLNDPASGVRAAWLIEPVDAPVKAKEDPPTLARRFRAARTWISEQAQMVPVRLSPANQVQEPFPVPKQTFGWSAGDASYAMGNFDLEDGQTLLIEGRSPACAFWNLNLWNPFLHTYDYAYDRVSINTSQVQYEADGSWKIYVSAKDPGQPNWLCTQGHKRGLLWFRWFLAEDDVVRPRTTLIGADGKPVKCKQLQKPPAVRLDDLADPKFPMMMRPIIKMLGLRVRNARFTPEAFCEEASKQTGLKNFGDNGFMKRLDVLCRSLREEAQLSDLGKLNAWEGTLQPLRNRLLLEDLYARHPEIEQVRIERPIIICGMPRTGTTHLLNLMSADPALRHLPFWESLEPVLAESERVAPGKKDPRIGRAAQACQFIDGLMPNFKRMHEMTADHAHEEIQLLAMDISGMLFETMSHVPGWRDYYKANDQTASYLYLRRVLKALSWLRGSSKRWVLKSPQHLEQFGPLLSAFPDASLVITYRDPVAITASMATMIAYSRRLSTAKPDPKAIGRYWADRSCDLLNSCVAWRDKLPADRSFDATLDDFIADEMGVLKRVYQSAGQPLEALALSKMAEYSEANPRGRHGTIEYDLKALGLDAKLLRERMSAYSKRFGVRDEGLK